MKDFKFPHALGGMPVTRRGVLAGAGAVAMGAAMQPVMLRAQGSNSIQIITPNGYTSSFSELLVAARSGHFAKYGLDAHVEGGKGGMMALQLAVSQQVDVGRTAGVVVVNAVAQGVPCKAIGTIAHSSVLNLISSEDDPVNTGAELAGASVGVDSLNGPADQLVSAVCLSAGIDPASVQRQIVPDNPASFGLVQAKRVKAYVGNFESIIRARAAGGKVHAVNLQKFMPLPGQVYVVNQDMLDNKKDMLVAFMRGLRDAVADIRSQAPDYAGVMEVLRSYDATGMSDEKLAVQIFNENVQTWLAEGEENILRNVPENWAKGVELAVATGALKEPVPAEKLYTSEITDEALS